MRRFRPAAALLLAVPLLVGCGATGGTGERMTEPTGSAVPAAGSTLVVTVRDSPAGPPRTWTLTCDPPGGDHPDPAAACRVLDAARAPFAPVPRGMQCLQVYGGPQTATIEGTWRGQPVRAAYRRTDGCEIARWDRLAAVLGPGAT